MMNIDIPQHLWDEANVFPPAPAPRAKVASMRRWSRISRASVPEYLQNYNSLHRAIVGVGVGFDSVFLK